MRARSCLTGVRSRSYTSYIRTLSPAGAGAGSARIPLKSTKNGIFGLAIGRGTRAYQEDTASATCVQLPAAELKHGYLRSPSDKTRALAAKWDPDAAGGDQLAGQLAWFACFDGHGGQNVSHFLRDNLHATFENVKPDMVTDTVQYTRQLGGYFRRFTGGLLERWVRKDQLTPVRAGAPRARSQQQLQSPSSSSSSSSSQSASASTSASPSSAPEPKKPITFSDLVQSAKAPASPIPPPSLAAAASSTPSPAPIRSIPPPEGMENEAMTLPERLTLAWLVADRQIQGDASLDVGGSTASVALLHSLDTPSQPFYSSSHVAITIAHLGDTRMLLCPTSDGSAIALTSYHHPDDQFESERLRKMGAGIITDSFGEARWMGALANTRAFGDSAYKKVGVTAEPEITSQVVRGDDFAFLIGFSDGIGGVLSDQEAVDLCRDARHPSQAAQNVLRFAEELGAQDNGTVLVVPLKGWGKIGGQDTTKERREVRRSKVDLYRDNRQ